ncbi:MAG: hypothetical protein CMN30_27850 [Sandaracinus sp.]|nr:hypothetical protein [Sandaracinus sp.]|tara:strand:+ start:970 stop:2940 length:1971 start_codon:yes stop_codon:yes gene_type:complete
MDQILSSADAGYALHPDLRGLQVSIATSGAPVAVRRLSPQSGELEMFTPPTFSGGAVFGLVLRTERPRRELRLRAICRARETAGRRHRVRFDLVLGRDDARRLNGILRMLYDGHQAFAPLDLRRAPEGSAASALRITQLLEAVALLHPDVQGVDDQGHPVHRFELHDAARWPSRAFRVDARTPRADYAFDVGPTGEGPRALRLFRVATRAEAMVDAPPRSELRVRHELFDAPLRLPLECVSRSVLLARFPGDELLFPGLHLPSTAVRWKGGQLHLDLRVLSFVQDPVHGPCVRLRVEAGSVDSAAWDREAARVCHPNTFLDASDVDGLWSLYAASGYLHISDKRPALFEPLRQSFVRAGRAMEAHPELGAQVRWRSLDGLDGSVTFLEAWSRTALIYQLARAADRPFALSGSRALYDLYLRATEHAVGVGADWFAVFVQHAGASFSKRVNRDLPARFADGERSFVGAFRAWEIPTDADDGDAGEVEVVEPDLSVTRAWAEGFAGRRPRAYREGYDLVPERLELTEPATRFGRAGLARERTFRMARVDGRPVAMAWMERVEDGVHLFGLLDSLRIDVFEPLGPEAHRAVRAALVIEARRWMRAHAKSLFVFFDEELGAEPVPSAIDLGDADQALFSTELSVELLEEVAIVVGAQTRE